MRWNLVAGGTAAALLGWEGLGRVLELRPDFLPTPSRILLEMSRQPLLREYGTATGLEILYGFLLAALVGIPLGVLLASSPRIVRLAQPMSPLLLTAPIILLAPLFFIWMGFGSGPKVVLSFLLCLFPAAFGMMSGLGSIPPDMIDLLRSSGAGPMQSFWKVALPMSVPCLFRGLRLAVLLSVVGTASAEFAAADEGLGYLMIYGMSRMETPLVFAALAVLAAIGAALYAALAALESALERKW